MIKMDFTVTHPWERPIYTYQGKPADTLLLTDTIDFRSKILNAFTFAAKLTNLDKRLPSSDTMAIYVDIESTQRCKALFVVKNICDSLQGEAFNDDSQVQSILVNQKISTHNRVKVALYINRRLYSERDVMTHQPLIGFNVSVPPVDCIIPTKKAYNHTISQNKSNEDAMNLITEELYNLNHCSEILDSVSRISINISTKQIRADLDNIGILYLLALDKLVYKDIESINSLVLNLDRRSTRENVTIEIGELTDGI